jgi:glucose-6-phosphate isomerase
VATTINSLRRLDAWQALARHADEIRDLHLRDLFADDRDRGDGLAIDAEGVYLDYSKNRATDETIGLLLTLAKERGLRDWIQAMFAGDRINPTEDRAVLHVALRAPVGARIEPDGDDVVAKVHDVLSRMSVFAERVRAGEWKGATVSRSATWSTSASAAPTSARRWPTRRSATTAGAT